MITHTHTRIYITRAQEAERDAKLLEQAKLKAEKAQIKAKEKKLNQELKTKMKAEKANMKAEERKAKQQLKAKIKAERELQKAKEEKKAKKDNIEQEVTIRYIIMTPITI